MTSVADGLLQLLVGLLGQARTHGAVVEDINAEFGVNIAHIA